MASPASRLRGAAFAALLPAAGSAQAHPFAQSYNLPVPFWMYAGGSMAALLLSFAVVGWLARPRAVELRSIDLGRPRAGVAATAVLKLLSIGSMLLCLATGLLGTRSAYFNFNMTFFWIVFVLGLTYLSAVVGGLYARINPWRQIVDALAGARLLHFEGRVAAPAGRGHGPALALYGGFIAFELFGRAGPQGLSQVLLAYTVLNVAGAWWFGRETWFERFEFFGVFFGLVSRIAPLQLQSAGGLRLQWPFTGLLQARATSMTEVLFVLFMLSSTAFDGLHATQAWGRAFWENASEWLAPWIGDNIVHTYPLLSRMFLGWQIFALLLSPFLYLLAYLACLHAMKRLVRSGRSLRELACRFAYSLLPIALVYHATHYWTLIVTQGLTILRLISDPFGVGWNLFGTALWLHRPLLPDMDWVWHSQVSLILAGHVASVWVAHLEALRMFGGTRTALLGQAPMLLLMLALTVFGLWILAQPITPAPP